jgi:predicted esterase
MEVLNSGKTSFKIEVPYRLYQTGETGDKPMILYLHGYGQDMESFVSATEPLHKLEAYHLYIQGPYPEYTMIRKGKKWGYSWYLYDGNVDNFTRSLEYTSEFIQGIIDQLASFVPINQLAIFGYSMGGYVGGYFGLTRWKHTNAMILTGCRIKTEVVSGDWDDRKHIKVLALHGKNDDHVAYERQEQEIALLREKGLQADIKLLEKGHGLSRVYLDEALKWLLSIGFKEIV